MIPLPTGWVETFGPRPKTGEQSTSYAWCDGDTNVITYYWGWWLVGLYFLKLHERWHATTRVFEDCELDDCVMSERKGLRVYWAVLKHRIKTGSWFCPLCDACQLALRFKAKERADEQLVKDAAFWTRKGRAERG